MEKKVLTIGIMSREKFRARTIEIAKGEYTPKRGEPKVWFESIQSMAQILSEENQRLLKIIFEKKPSSLKELSELTGRKTSNLSRTLKTMSRFGLVDLGKEKKSVRPVVKATNFKVEFGIGAADFFPAP